MKRDPRRDLQELLDLVWSEKGEGLPLPELRVRRKSKGMPGGRYLTSQHAIVVSFTDAMDWRNRWVLLHEAAHALLGRTERGHTLAYWQLAFTLYREYGEGFDLEEVLLSECAYRRKSMEGARRAGIPISPELDRELRAGPRDDRRRVLYVVPGLDYSRWQKLVNRHGKVRVFRAEEAAREELRQYRRHHGFEFAVVQDRPGSFVVQFRVLGKNRSDP